jgi:hypothetical protein
MENYTFDFELETMFTMFMSAMDNIIVKRFNNQKDVQDQIKVRFLYAPKQRVLLDLLDKAQNIQLPVVSVSNGGITRDQSRVFNKIKGSYIAGQDRRFSNRLLQPVPIDLTINMSILTRYQKDFDQIITNFAPYFDPYIEISWRVPNVPDYEIRSSVYWSGTINSQYPTDGPSSQIARVQGDTSFTFKGWLFKAMPESDGNIFKIHTDYNLTKKLATLYTADPNITDEFMISAIPQPKRVIYNYFNNSFDVLGKSFFNVDAVYLSGDSVADISTLYNPFSASHSLSAGNPAFNATLLPTSAYNVTSETNILIDLPYNVSSDTKVIVSNPAGYGFI